MLNYILKRLFYGFWVFLGVITVVFFLFNILPGDPARMMLGQRADQGTMQSIKKDLGLDQPKPVQFLCYLNNLSPLSLQSNDAKSPFYLDSSKYSSYTTVFQSGSKILILKKPYLGRSYQSKRQVSEILWDAFPKTALLALASILIALVLGIVVGVFSAIFENSIFDRSAFFFSILGMSVPSFFAAMLVAWVFAYLLADYTGFQMFGTLYTVDDLGRGEYLDLKNLILPAITLGIRPLALMIELTKSSMLDVLSQDYIRTARAKGLTYGRVIRKHALKNAMNPILTSASGWFASLISGAVFVEYIFDWKGMGTVIIEGLEKYDFPVVMGSLLFVCVILVIINILVDISYAILDPRIRLQ